MSEMNRLNVLINPYQGKFKKVLCVCSAGILRSPTAAVVLSQEPYNYNTRCAGVDEAFALIPVDKVLLAWADEIVVMEDRHKRILEMTWKTNKPIKVLGIPDQFAYRDPQLINLIKQKYGAPKQVVEVE